MRPISTWPRRVLATLSAVGLVTAVAALGAAPPAAAHGTLGMATPAEGSTVTEPLTIVELYFTEQVASNAYFTVTAPGGGRVDNGWAYGSAKPLDQPVREYFLVEGKFEPREYTVGYPALVTVAHLPAAGQYSVSYLSVASDGDPVRGTLTFRYTGRPTPAPQDWSPPTNQPDPALLAAAEGHGSGQAPPSAAATPPGPAPATPLAAPPATAQDPGPPGWIGWTGWVVALVTVLAGLALWRRGEWRGSTRTRSGRPGAKGVPAAKRGPSGRPSGERRRATATRVKEPTGSGRRAAVPSTRKGGAVGTVQATAPPPPGASTVESEVADTSPPATAAGPSNTRLALLTGGLVVALLAGFGLGRLGGTERTPGGSAPVGVQAATGNPQSATDGHQHGPGTGPHTHPGDADTALAMGTAVNGGGYLLQPVRRTQPAGETVDYAFRILGTDRQPATRFAIVHDKPLHMIVVGRDLSGYQHLHPTMAPDGTWTVPLKLVRPGGYRIYADFTVIGADGTTGQPLVLGVDHVVPGAHTPAELPPPRPQATAGPFAVSLEGTPTIGVTAPMFLRVSRPDAPEPAPLERYLGAYGHLVVIREGDLGYVHVHPEPELVDGAVKFWLTAPSAGRYRAYFDFQVGGEVHTAEYTLELG
ncbi:copper resistance protein CopC [Solwaraspora sp. WMMD1047]|uniref:copper resistance protein CopC n=1 Tax=Solwaraspora sp. WMMD1047 TaxID=3016102 RepID=UPI002415BB59|nr:copper resistance protein CopC [Solwaraspora sp. WMMD1047]MDG4830686.1 copper resistance protein CopC [Solwaraspora sp. WMMD1047]